MREMKNSGIEWIGEIPVGWEIIPNKRIMRKVKNVCEKYNGEDVLSLTMNGVIKRDLDNPSGKMPLSFDGYQYIKAGNLLMCLFDIDVTPRCIGVIENDGVTSPAYSQFELNKNAHLKYYYYYYLNLDYSKQLLHLAKNLRHSLTESQLGEILTPIPPYKEQHRISTYLDTKCEKIDSIIARQQEVIEKLKAYKLSVITEAVTKGLNPDVRMKDSGVEWIGDVPEHWEIIKARFVIDKIGDIDHYMPNSVDDGFPYIMIGDLAERLSKIAFPDCKQVSKQDYEMLSLKMKPSKGDVIFARYATIGTVCYVDEEADFLVSYSCVTVKPSKEKMFGLFLYYYFKSAAFIEDVKQYINSNTQGNVGIESLYRVKFTIPSLKEQQQIADYLDKKCSAIDSAIAKKQAIIEKLTEYKKSLIYEVVTGKKEV